MKKHFCSLSKGFFKKTFAVVLTLSMLFALAPKRSLSALAAGKSENLATSATVSTNAALNDAAKANLVKLNDGDQGTSLWRTGWPTGATEKDYYQLDWATPVSANQISLVVTNALKQAPVAWHVQVLKDGATDWTDVAKITEVQWTGSGTETKNLTFALQNNIKGLRVWIDAAHLLWKGYAVNEIAVYNDPDATVDSMSEDSKSLAVSATLSTNVTLSGWNEAYLAQLNDGMHVTSIFRNGMTSAASGTVEDYYQFDWANPVSVNQVSLVVTKALSQAPTAWDVEVSKDGTNWTKVASVSDVKWENSNETVETKKLAFDLQEGVKGLRVDINVANLAFSGYGIQEIEVLNVPADLEPADPKPEDPKPADPKPEDLKTEAPANGNYASVAEVSTNIVKAAFTAEYLKRLNDDNYETAIFRTGEAAEIEGKDYYQYTWRYPASVNQVVLAAIKTDQQAPTAWHVEVTKDGTNWTKVGSVSNVQWEYKWSENLEKKALTFELQEDIVGLRVYIDKANLAWNGYGIQEIEVRNVPNASISPQTGDDMPVAVIMFVLVISAVGVATSVLGYRKNRKYI